MNDQFDRKDISVKDVDLDEDNPRFFHLMHNKGKKGLAEQEIENEILNNDDDTPALTKSIQRSGVKDPIWVVQKGGRYVVVEGNRRTVVLRQLIRDEVKPPSGVKYDVVPANILPSDTPQQEIVLQKARLQSGKKAWGAYNEAALTFQLRDKPYLMEFADIAVELKIPIAKVKERIENYKLFNEYAAETTDDNPKRFAYFSDCPTKVKAWFQDSEKNKKNFFKLICPIGGKNKIKSVATRGGLRDFAKVVESPEALKLLIEDSTSTVEDALDLAKDADIKKAIPFINKIMPLALEMRSLDASQLERLKSEVKVKVNLRALKAACEEVINKLGK